MARGQSVAVATQQLPAFQILVEEYVGCRQPGSAGAATTPPANDCNNLAHIEGTLQASLQQQGETRHSDIRSYPR
jgi:hypothetical protein